MARAAQRSRPGLRCLLYAVIQAYRKKHQALLLLFFLECRFDLILDPGACKRVFREQEEQFVLQVNRLINTRADFIAGFHVLRGEPAAYPLGLQIGMETMSKGVVFVRVADEQRMILNGAYPCGPPEFNPLIGDTSFTQEVEGAAIG